MVPFAGYDMPLQYRQGIIAEHLHTRTHASLFDVSHMGQAILRGDGAVEALESLVVADLQGMLAGTVRYTLLTNEQGGIIDDLMVIHGGYYLVIVVNAARKEADFAHIIERIGDRCDIEIWHDRALLALQGPEAVKVFAQLAPASRHMLFMTAENFKIGPMICGATRSGYTGEDGFEITRSGRATPPLSPICCLRTRASAWPVSAPATRCDSRRGLCLYGHDIDETTTPVEAGLAWTIGKRRRETRRFPRRRNHSAPDRRGAAAPPGRHPAGRQGSSARRRRDHRPALDHRRP